MKMLKKQMPDSLFRINNFQQVNELFRMTTDPPKNKNYFCDLNSN